MYNDKIKEDYDLTELRFKFEEVGNITFSLTAKDR